MPPKTAVPKESLRFGTLSEKDNDIIGICLSIGLVILGALNWQAINTAADGAVEYKDGSGYAASMRTVNIVMIILAAFVLLCIAYTQKKIIVVSLLLTMIIIGGVNWEAISDTAKQANINQNNVVAGFGTTVRWVNAGLVGVGVLFLGYESLALYKKNMAKEIEAKVD